MVPGNLGPMRNLLTTEDYGRTVRSEWPGETLWWNRSYSSRLGFDPYSSRIGAPTFQIRMVWRNTVVVQGLLFWARVRSLLMQDRCPYMSRIGLDAYSSWIGCSTRVESGLLVLSDWVGFLLISDRGPYSSRIGAPSHLGSGWPQSSRIGCPARGESGPLFISDRVGSLII